MDKVAIVPSSAPSRAMEQATWHCPEILWLLSLLETDRLIEYRGRLEMWLRRNHVWCELSTIVVLHALVIKKVLLLLRICCIELILQILGEEHLLLKLHLLGQHCILLKS